MSSTHKPAGSGTSTPIARDAHPLDSRGVFKEKQKRAGGSDTAQAMSQEIEVVRALTKFGSELFAADFVWDVGRFGTTSGRRGSTEGGAASSSSARSG
jgi:hypothetical protein